MTEVFRMFVQQAIIDFALVPFIGSAQADLQAFLSGQVNQCV
jgi:hypothetical protein